MLLSCSEGWIEGGECLADSALRQRAKAKSEGNQLPSPCRGGAGVGSLHTFLSGVSAHFHEKPSIPPIYFQGSRSAISVTVMKSFANLHYLCHNSLDIRPHLFVAETQHHDSLLFKK